MKVGYVFCEKCGKEIEGKGRICTACAEKSNTPVAKVLAAKSHCKLMVFVAAIVGIIGNCMPWYSLMGSTITGVEVINYGGSRGMGLYVIFFATIVIMRGATEVLRTIPKKAKHKK